MAKANVVTRVLGGDRLECTVVSPDGETLTLTGGTTDVEPVVEGSELLARNPALVTNAWAFAKFTHLKVSLPTREEQQLAAKRAAEHEKDVLWLSDLADDEVVETKTAWCSSCFVESEHRKGKRPFGQFPAYVCANCGSATLPCADPTCHHMATRERGSIRVPRYCAEHRHEIASFEKSGQKIDSLVDYREVLEFDKPNLSRRTKLVGGSVAVAAVGIPAALLAAPAIGGAVGTLLGSYSGAAATSYGLALLGGGSIASGGAGMAGGTLVVTAVGGALGCGLGASVTHAYVREDKSFHIEMLQGGDGPTVIVCNGFLTENSAGWGDWKTLVTARYPDSPVYRVHWGAKELKDLGALAGFGSAGVAGTAKLKDAAVAASKASTAKLAPLTPVLASASLAKNPWHVAKNRAEKTGVIVADLLARTNTDSFVLIGHSLGARAMVVAAQTLATKDDAPRIESAHLLGAAIGAKSDWSNLTAAVDDAVYAYHSENDGVLKWVYRVAQGGQTAAGLSGFTPANEKLQNIDVTDEVGGHSAYFASVALR